MLLLLLLLAAGPAQADTVIAARNLRPQSVVGPGDLILQEGSLPGAYESLTGLVGMEARVTLYAGRPVRPGDLGPPALVERNGLVSLVYDRGGLSITAEGRALDRAGVGEMVRVMNLASRLTVSGVVQPDGSVRVK
ncbi:flagellar basal body P-ring formation protein FlgA [Pseudooceanicola sp. CBS1P-1]|uniref:Flagella basal body P-ring formation protein FlgA n=1 Tax=Pseudooceanicola albus TaxID=2692189 RepID=A0A6L7G9V5_9RHOB|nr:MULTISPECIES: flagellar basal body P-ring formation chaperone FlgA [Pseudooceanicola]MBT9385859.1 flagellar basal body P-ring formation protein FlgA [Pseudooceanicola endophyticus]MXN20090.1 flagellar basal body P-ring formation protein FlgA [Pseudooceanicola albus]